MRGALVKTLPDVEEIDAPLGYLFTLAKTTLQAKSKVSYEFETFDHITFFNKDDVLLEQ